MLVAELKRILRESPYVHFRSNPASDLRELVQLFDRFVDGPMRYPLEWDDFISWRNESPEIEQVRVRLAAFDALLSESRDARRKYIGHVLEERNKVAARLGLPAREITL